MINTRNDVKDFMVAGDQVDFGFGPQSDLYMNLITEEVIHETLRDFDKKDLVGIADGIADSIWVIEGLCVTLELDLPTIWKNVKDFLEYSLETEPNLSMCNLLVEYSRVRMEYLLLNKEFIDDAITHLLKELCLLSKILNIPLQEVWDEVSRSNMSKISDNGKVIKNEHGKIQKPDTFSPADIKSILEQHNLV